MVFTTIEPRGTITMQLPKDFSRPLSLPVPNWQQQALLRPINMIIRRLYQLRRRILDRNIHALQEPCQSARAIILWLAPEILRLLFRIDRRMQTAFKI